MIKDFAQLAKGRSMVFYDMRNRGRSDLVAEDAKLQGGYQNDVDDLEAVRRNLGLNRIDLIGHSTYGMTVVLYATKYPEHVNRIVQISPPPPNWGKQYPPNLSYSDATDREVPEQLAKIQSESASKDPVETCKQTWSAIIPFYVFDPAYASKLGWDFCNLATERNMGQYFNKFIVPSIQNLNLKAGDFAKITMPVLTIHGTKDRTAPYGGAREWAMLLPNARLISIDYVAHIPYVEASEQVFRSIWSFLDGNWPDTAKKVESLDPKNFR
jgi:proline iminopeptidase